MTTNLPPLAPAQPQQRVIGYQPVYAPVVDDYTPSLRMPQPPPPGSPETRWGDTMFDRVMCAVVGLALGALGSWYLVDAIYGGADVRAIQAERDRAVQQQQVLSNTLNEARGVLGCQ